MTSTLPPAPPRADERVDPPIADLWRIPPSTAILASLVVGGLSVDLGIRHPVGMLSFIAVALGAGAGLHGGWIRGPLARRLLLLALVPAALLVLRDSPWLTLLNLCAIAALAFLAAAARAETHSISRALGRLLSPVGALEPAVRSVDLVSRSARAAVIGRDRLGRRVIRLLRGLAIGAPIVAALVALLAAADALFRSWLEIPFDLGTVFQHTLIIVFGAAVTMTVAGHGAWATVRPHRRPRRVLGPSEASIVLVGVVAVYTVFVVAQVLAIAAGAGYVERTTGLTYAEYARAGFFQLVAAAILTLAVLVALRRYRQTSSPKLARRLLRLELSTVGLTLIAVGVAVRRLFLYEAEFGLTMLRFSTIVFAVFIGFVFMVTGLSIAGRLRHDAVVVVAVGALATLVAISVANPERIVAQRNIDRFGGTDRLDVDYLVDNLGADALPSMLTDPAVSARLCASEPAVDDRVIVFNWSRSRAADALAAGCE